MSEKVCIIGAGSSGIVAAKTLQEQGIPFDCFEMGSDIGGNWRYENDNGRSAAYRSLHIDTSKDRMAFSDFPMPDEYPNFPHHSQVLRYFESYADHFGIRPLITFHTKVERVTPRPGGGYDVTTRDLESGEATTAPYRAVLVCNGHHWAPKWPDFPGEFAGQEHHSHSYRTPEPYLGKNVLVVGMGNSAVDIACDLAHVAQSVTLSTRRGAHVIPRYILGRPVDKWITPASSRLPLSLTRLAYRALLRIAVGNQEKYGVPRPDHPILAEHPTMSSELLTLAALGEIEMKPNAAELRGDHVRFADGSETAVDTIIYATGYRIAFPFFDDDFIRVQENEIPLYRKVVHPNHPYLYFIGLIQPLGAIMPLAELQVEWVAGLLEDTIQLPDEATMWAEIAQTRAEIRDRYVDSTRHTIQVDFYPYKRSLQQEMARYAVDGRSPIRKWLLPATVVALTALTLLLIRRLRIKS